MDSATVILALLAEGRTDEARRVTELDDPLYSYAQAIAERLEQLERLRADNAKRGRQAVANYRARHTHEMST